MAQATRLALPPRSTDDRVVAGVCAGIARAVALDPLLVRVAVVVLTVAGPGLPFYVITWLVMPESANAVQGEAAPAPAEVRRGVGLILIVLGAVLALRELGLTPPDAIILPIVLVGFGVGLVLWQLQPRLDVGRWDAVRIGGGVIVVGAGVAAFVAGNLSLGAVRDSVVATGLVVVGLGLILGPWIVVLVRDRTEERRRRVAADARADMAAHLHDSVLQTFALMQRTDDPHEMASLARQQERELRRWLYADRDDPDAATLRTAISQMTGLVEDRHDVNVETVIVGDAALGPALEALVAATGEAATNAAKWSGCPSVSVFVEVDEDRVHAYVRDKGAGFAIEEIGADRLGVRESIQGRMERVGGTSDIATAPGEGTEVHLSVPLTGGTVGP